MTMSTNLGWPSEPEPGPEHRRLGWLARMLGVSRETIDPTHDASERDAISESAAEASVPKAVHAATSGDVGPSSVGSANTGDLGDDPSGHGGSGSSQGRHDAMTGGEPVETSAPGTPAASQGAVPVGEPQVSEGAVGGASVGEVPVSEAPGAQPDPIESAHEAFPANTAPVAQERPGELDASEAPGAQPDPIESAHEAFPANAAPVADEPPSELDASRDDASAPQAAAPGDGPADAEPVNAPRAYDMAPRTEKAAPVEVAGTAPGRVEEGTGDGQGADSAPVDNAVDDGHEMPPVELETATKEAGDNAVDEAERTSQLAADRADREALAAAIPIAGTDTPLAMELAENARRRIHLTGRPFPKPVAARVLTVANQKGGVGKTTTTVNVAAALAQSGLRTLVIDLDPQGNASTALGIDHHAEVPSIYDVLVDSTPLLDVVQRCTTVDNLYCAPATIDLAGAEIELVSLVARESRLQKAIAGAVEAGHEFDYILIDCPPSLGLLTVNAMVAASEVFIPIQCEYYALEGLSQLLKNIDLVKRHLNPTLHVSTILLTMYDARTRLSAQVADEVREHFPKEVLRTTVPRSVRVSEAPSFGETVMTYDPSSSGALAYLEAAGEMADRGAAGRT